MKTYFSMAFLAFVVFGAAPAMSAYTRTTSSANLGTTTTTRTRTVNYNNYRPVTNYNAQPVKRSDLYKNMSTTQSTRTTKTTKEVKRKYYLAHPFFQPTKGKFGSVTDLSYATNSYKMAFVERGLETLTLDGTTYNFYFNPGDTGAKWGTKSFSVKEDFSFGITDKLALIGMAKYDSTKYKLNWDDDDNVDDKMDDNGVNFYGIGAQWRFVDSSEWIATASAYFQQQKDVASNLIAELKAGYKVDTTTIYGLARGWYVDFKEESYGNGIEGKNSAGDVGAVFLAYKTGVSDAFYAEGGLGVFSVIDEDWTLNLEAVLGNYDWHSQGSIRGAIGWQPNDWFALNIYAKTAFYDNAEDKNVGVYGYNYAFDSLDTDGNVIEVVNIPGWQQLGTAKISDYKETSVGVQAIFMF